MMNTKSLFVSLCAAALLFNGCGDKDKKDQESKQEVTASSIKVTQDVVKKDDTKEVSKENSGQFYYSYNKEGKSDEAKKIDKYNSESSKSKTTIDAYLHVKSPYEHVQITMMIKQLSKNYIIKCSPCHDDYANGIIGPSLLDKDKQFIYQKIIDFKTGKSKNVLMEELVKQIDNKELEDIAGEIANFNKEIREMRKKR
ncbi:c-type cytochrome [Sulfurospirillum sp. 1612]|uniref:c-type cytochrome n=1 Tax=Sulfurospirillum sp. 1612 TaxID=3094835 RepID=UPI002F935D7F